MNTLIMTLLLMVACLTKGFAGTGLITENKIPSTNLIAVNPQLPVKSDPCYVSVTVPKTGSSMDCYGNYHFINVTGTCVGFSANCDIAFFEAQQCARNKANDAYNVELSRIRNIQCAVTTISAE